MLNIIAAAVNINLHDDDDVEERRNDWRLWAMSTDLRIAFDLNVRYGTNIEGWTDIAERPALPCQSAVIGKCLC